MKRRFILTLALALGVNALWAGAVLFRVLIDLPARHRIGPMGFAELSRATDLSAGLVFYPAAAVGSAVLSVLTWFVARRTNAPRPIRVATGVAATCTILVLALTTQAAPLMFRIGSAAADPTLIEDLADRFTWWTNLRAASAAVAAAALLYALTACALANSFAGSDEKTP